MLLPLALLNTALAAGEPEFLPRLLEVRLAASAVPAGGTVAVGYTWQNAGRAPWPGAARVFVHVRPVGGDEASRGRFGADHEPAVVTSRWQAGRVVRYTAMMQVPPDTPPGEYLLLVGLFDPDTGERLEVGAAPAHDGTRRYRAAQFTVLPAGRPATGGPLVNTFAPVPESTPTAPVAPPARTVTVGQGALKLVLDAEQPRAVTWRLGDQSLPGDPELASPLVRVLAVADGTAQLAGRAPYAVTWTVRAEAAAVTYHGTVSRDGQPAVEFDLVYSVGDGQAEVTLANVVERAGQQLLAVETGRLVATGAAGKLALPWHAGRLVDPRRAEPAERRFGLDWFSQMLAGVVHGGQLAAAVSLPGLDDRLVATVDNGWAALGASFEHRVAARPPVPSLRLTERTSARLQFTRVAGRAADWLDGARLLRAQVTARPWRGYRDATIYKIFCDDPKAKQYTTFDQALALVRQVHHLTDGLPQIAYLVGWQHTGHDTGYPDVFTVNQRLGGLAALRRVMAEAAKYGAVLSFHDNYDDAYEHSPAWDPAIISRDPAGNLQQGGVWSGGQSYILSFSPPAVAQAIERVERTLATYPIRDSYHIDVLTAALRRYDFNPRQPASGTVTWAGKRAIVAAFNRHGVDVTSEGFMAPAVGVIGHAWHLMRSREPLFSAEERIPFTPFVYHGHATWGGGVGGETDYLDALLYGGTYSADFTARTPLKDILDRIYLLHLPFRLLREREATSYTATGTKRRMSYGEDSFVEVDEATRQYQVVVDGRLVARNFSIFTPSANGAAWLAYARAAGPVDYPAPPGWSDGTTLDIVELTPDGPGATRTAPVANGRVQLELKANVPVAVRRR